MTEANIRELKNIVKSFRVSELQTLLEFAGRLKAGRKQELLDRALSLIDKGCPTSIVVKINDLNRRRGGNISATSSSASHESSKVSASMLTAVPPKIPQTSSSEKMSLSRESSGIVPTTSSHSLVPVHPDVRLKSLPFYDLVAELVKPSSLSPKGMSRLQANTFTFHLTPQQTEDISASKELIDDCVVEYGLQVLVRFALMETTSEQEDNFPSGISVRVNDKIAALPNPIPTNKPGVEPKRPGRPVNITHICILSPTAANVISVTWSADHIRNFCISVCLAQHLNSDILLSRLKQNGMRHPDHTRALIKEKLASSSDNEIATTSLRISLRCPVGKMRMSIPCRSAMCSHLQCFDARTFIQMNEKKPTWTCPICDRPAEFKTLIIDGLFSEILVKASESIDIQFSADGNWFPIRPKEEEVKIEDDSLLVQTIADSPDKADSIEMIDLTESDDDTDSVRSRPASAFGVEYLPLPEYAKTLSMFSSTTSKECNSGLSFGLGRGEPANSIVSELSLPPPLTLQTPHLGQSETLFPIHEKPPSLLPFGDIWDYHTVPSTAPLEYPDVRFRPSSSGFMPPSRSDPILAGSSLLSLPMDIEASCHFSSSGSQSMSLTAASSLSRPNSASPDVISLD